MTGHDRALLDVAMARMSPDDINLARLLHSIELFGDPDSAVRGTPPAHLFLAHNLRDLDNRRALRAALDKPVVR